MENVVDRPKIVERKGVVKLARVSPFADTPIPLYLGSVTGMRYRTLNCMECGAEMLERNNEMMYRLNDGSMPAEIPLTGASVKTMCGNCQQWYGIQISVTVNLEQGGVPLYMQPQSLYLVVEQTKKLRYVHCLECGNAFNSISDRIRQVVDNRVPFEFVDPEKIGPIESLCHFNNCGQTWALML